MPSSETLGLDRRQFMKTAAGAVLLAGAGVLGVSAAARAEAFPMPALPYAESALDPVISARTVSFHYGKHTAAYYANANKAVAENPALSGKTMEEIVSLIYDEPSMSAVFNNVAQALNHTFYWSCLKPGGGGEPSGRIKAAIEATFSSAAYFRKALSEAAIAQFASGWGLAGRGQGPPQDRAHAQRRHPHRARLQAPVRDRRLGACLLPGLPEQTRGLRQRRAGQAHQLGVRGKAA